MIHDIDALIDIPAAAKILGISARSAYKLVETRKLGHYRPGVSAGRIMTTERDCRKYLASVRVEPVGEASEPAPTRKKNSSKRTNGDVKERLARFGIKI